ncbi:MAG: AMIN domain-containing protein [bacterium]|nr:AMIN domain-containing protein [bacterium]
MKTCLPITILLALVLATSASAAQVGSLRLAYENGATVARIDVQGPFQFTHATEVPKDGKPDRLIVDIIGATHSWGPKEWGSLPQCSVTKLRIGQYSSKPEKVVRVVFELTKAPVYQADSDGKTITIRLTDASAKQFAAWSSGPAPVAAPVVPAVTSAPAVANATQPAVKPVVPATTPKPAVTTPSTTPAIASAPKADVKPAEKPANHSTFAQQQPVAVKSTPSTTQSTPPAAPATKPAVVNPPASKPAPTVAANEPKSTPATTPAPAVKPAVSAPKVESKPAPVVANADQKSVPPTASTQAVKPAVVAPKVESKPAPVVATAPAKSATTPTQPATATPAAVSPKVETKPAPVVASQPTAPSPAVKSATPVDVKPVAPVVAQATPKAEVKADAPAVKPVAPVVAAKPDQLAKADQFKAPVATQTTLADKAATQPNAAVKPVAPVVATANDVVANKPADVKPAATEAVKPQTADPVVKAPEKPVLADASDDADATGIATPARQTARFRRTATASARMKSSLVAEFPQRLVIKYENMGYRDPFATLIDDTRTYDTPIEKRLANVEGLRLVGILENSSGDNRALFQDKRNFSYMLKAGDKVEKGYVLRVESDKVYFQVFEYGWSRTVALTFDNRD